MSIEESNILIAEFIGIDQVDIDTYLKYNKKGLQYHYKWDWLMPVIRKITTNEDWIDNEYRESIMDTIPYGIIEDSYKVVVEFIKWYNRGGEGTSTAEPVI